MTITRVQQVTAVLTGTSDTVTLPSPPSYGNTLIAVLAGAGSAPLATSLTQSNVTWVSLASGDNGDQSAYHVFYGQNIGVVGQAGQTITVTRSAVDDYQIAVFEYDGLQRIGTLLDAANSTTGDGYSPATGATTAPTVQAEELFLGLFSRTSRDVLLRDSLDSDAGYWRLDTSVPTTLVFTGGGADVSGVAYAEPAGFATWSNISVAADVSGTSGFVSSGGFFGVCVYSSGDLTAPSGNGFAGAINTLDNNAYSYKVVGGVPTLTAYPAGTLNPGQVYRLELRARSTSTGAVLLDFLIDGVVIFSETHTGTVTAGTGAMAVSTINPTPATFNNFEVLELSGRHIRTDGPTNGFVEVMESSIAEAAASRVMLACYEKVSDVIDQPDVTVQAEDFVTFSAHIQTFIGDLSSEFSIARPVSLYVADNVLSTQSLDMLVGEARSLVPLDLSVNLIDVFERYVGLDMIVAADGWRFVDLNVSVQPFRLAYLDVSTLATIDATAALDMYIGVSPPTVATRRVFLRVALQGQDLRLQTRMDVAILVEPEPTDISTTPELSRYLLCRPLWCNVPKEKSVWARIEIDVGGIGTRTATMDLHVQGDVTMDPVFMTVFIKPEP